MSKSAVSEILSKLIKEDKLNTPIRGGIGTKAGAKKALQTRCAKLWAEEMPKTKKHKKEPKEEDDDEELNRIIDEIANNVGTGYGGSDANKKAAKKNPWIKFLKAYRKVHPTIPHNELFKRASRQYHKHR